MYISPDILTEDEWNVMGSSMRWAQDRFPVLSTTEMIGGDPKKREAYGYVHFKEQRAVLAVRNPWITETRIRVPLNPSQGLDKDASGLVLERVYPTRWISPTRYKAGETLMLPLGGYETAVYEMYPLAEAKEPLLAGVTFATLHRDAKSEEVLVQSAGKNAVLLNPEIASVELSALRKLSGISPEPILKQNLSFHTAKTSPELSWGTAPSRVLHQSHSPC
jgi:phenylpropionate dioxygenase-like ring-hydroxylating dioxygenase large terminal subunit